MKKLPLGSLRAGEWTELFCLSHAVVVFLSVFYFLIKFGPGQYRHLLATIFGLVIALYLVWIQGIVVLAIGTARLRAALQIGTTNLANSQIIPFPHILSFLVTNIILKQRTSFDELRWLPGLGAYVAIGTVMTCQPLFLLAFMYGYFHRLAIDSASRDGPSEDE